MDTLRAERSSRNTPADRDRRDATPWNSHQWCRYFRRNATQLLEIPWEQGVTLTPAERDAIAESVREFQLGESAEGRHFVGAAKAYAARSGDHEYVDAVRLLIAEEQRHARELGRFLDLAGIPRARATWSDGVFRWLRKRAGLEVCVAVLLTAEIIAKVYYDALAQASDSLVLARICAQILRDEEEHVRFQAERLGLLRAARFAPAVFLSHAMHRLMLAVASLVVWRKHRHALRAGGYGFFGYWRACQQELRIALHHMAPTRRRKRPWFSQSLTAAKS